MYAANRRLDNHHPGISGDGRYVVYLETTRAQDLEPATCAVHFHDRDSGAYTRVACPPALVDGGDYLPFFSARGGRVEWVEEGAPVGVHEAVIPQRTVEMQNPLFGR